MSKARTAAQNRYIAKKYDRINLTVDKGEKLKIAAHAKLHCESVNGFINRAIKEAMERDSVENLNQHLIQSSPPDCPESEVHETTDA